jgi:hypothetical protein
MQSNDIESTDADRACGTQNSDILHIAIIIHGLPLICGVAFSLKRLKCRKSPYAIHIT